MTDIARFAKLMPKVELHVHLEGSIRPHTLLELAKRNNVQLPARDLDSLRKFYKFRDFPHFVEVYTAVTNCLRSPDDYHLIAYEYGANCARQNIKYSEVTFTIETNTRITGLVWQDILCGLNEGRRRARDEFGIEMRWIFDISRNHPGTQEKVVDIALDARDQGVVALGLGGDEASFPPELFTRSFGRAWQAGLPCVPHAGETAGPESIWTAINELHALRIGHGVRSIEDPELVEFLRSKQIPLEICPTSNIRLGIYRDYTSHPLRQLWDAGLYITVNSDDPPMFETDLNQEYQALVDHFGFIEEELEQVSLNSLRASLLEENEKNQMVSVFKTEFHRLKQTPV
jgi:aminodeoxyfutalosine deaminase